jgi:probable rRNA maturation factor
VTVTITQPIRLAVYDLNTLYQSLFETIRTTLSLPDNLHVDVWMTSNQTIRRYNRQYRQKDVATDVLSFPLYDASFTVPTSMPHPIGQLIISHQKAKQQANTYGHSFVRELSFLFVHGVLHCLGYNHETPEDEKNMLALQDTILGKRVP